MKKIKDTIICLHYATPQNPWKKKKKRKGITPTLKWQSCLRRWGLEQSEIGIKQYFRFLMNSQLVTAGYPWVVIPVERREEYIAALARTRVEENIEGFVGFWGY